MGNGLLAQWRRRIAGRGLVGALLLSVPVAVAAALGFSGAFSDFGSGLRAIGSIGGESPDAAQSAPLSRVITPAASPAGATAADGGAGATAGARGALGGSGGSAGEFGGGDVGGEVGGGEVGGGGVGGVDAGGGVGGVDVGGGALPGVPDVDLPVGENPGGGSIVDGVNDTVNGLLDGRN